MSATGEAPLFDNDGTQSSVPQDLFPDALSGPVATSGSAQRDAEYGPLRIADPVEPHPDAVREILDAALLAENGAQEPAAIPSQSTGPPGSPVVPGQPPLGMLPQQRTWPMRSSQLPRLARKPKPRPETDDLEEVEEAQQPKRKRVSRGFRAPRPSSSSAGVLVAVILVVVFAVLAIQFLISLFSGIAGIFS